MGAVLAASPSTRRCTSLRRLAAHDTVGAVCRSRPCAAGPVLTSHVDPLTNVVFTRVSSVNVFVAQERYLRCGR